MRKIILIISFLFRDKNLIKALRIVDDGKKFSKSQILEYQNVQLRSLIEYSYKNVEYYRCLFDELNLKPKDIQTIDDLIKLPILSKDDVRNNFGKLKSKNIKFKLKKGQTGGSTGKPLNYLTTSLDTSLSLALLLNGYNYAGYKLGDKVLVIGGSSLIKNNANMKQKLKNRLLDFVLNQKTYSTAESNKETFNRILNYINSQESIFLRGYKSSIYLLACHIDDNNLEIQSVIKAVFTTSEKLMPSQRELIERVFTCKVFDQYGLNDGGISAFENDEGNMLIDFERAILEVVDNENNRISGKEGKIIATQLYNYAMPLIRYDSEDLGIVEKNEDGKDILIDITGKSNDIIKIGNNYNVTPILNNIIRSFEVGNYQVYREQNGLIILVSKIDEEKRKDLFLELQKRIRDIPIEVNIVDEEDFLRSSNNKHKYIINNYKNGN